MGNENKVNSKEIIEKSKAMFLPDEVKPDALPYVYSLEEEFAKTKKNKSYLFYLAVIGFIALVVILTIFITAYVQNKSRAIDINISEFEDLKLRDLLDSSRKYEAQLNALKDELDDIKLKMNNDVLRVKDDAARQRENILAKNLSEAETQKQLARVKDSEDRKVKAVRASYQKRISDKEQEIAALKKQIASQDSKMRSNIQKAEDIVSNYQKLHKMKMDKQKAEYEDEIRRLKDYHQRYIASLILKYNPIFRSDRILKIINTPVDTSSKSLPKLRGYMPELRRENVISEGAFRSIRDKIANEQLVTDRMKKIPYENSVPSALNSLDSLSRNIISDYENLWYSLVLVIQKKNRQLGYYGYAFNFLSRENPESGYITDPRDPKHIRLHMMSFHKVKEGDTALVFRSDDDYIGKIQFFNTFDGLAAKTLELVQGKKMEPFDKILIKIKKD